MNTSLCVLLLCLTALLCVRLPLTRLNRILLLFILALFGAGLVVSLGDSLSLLQKLYGGIGDLSAASFLIAVLVLLERLVPVRKIDGFPPFSNAQWAQFYGFILCTGMLLYPMTLGLSRYDPYSLGFSPLLLPLAMILLVFVAVMAKNALLSLWLLLASVGYVIGVYDSRNFWDYLIDPWIWLYSFFAVFRFRAGVQEKILNNPPG